MLHFNENKAGKDAPENWHMTGIVMTGNFKETDNPYRNIPYDIEIQMQELHMAAQKGTIQGIKKLERLVEKYPRVPALYNYLSIAYMNHGNMTKCNKINEILIKKFPDYHIGRINQANSYIIKNELEKAEEILGQTMELSAFLPNRKIYHISEVVQFYETTIRFFIKKRDFEVADSRLRMLKDISPKNDGFHNERIKQLEDEKAYELELIEEEYIDSLSVAGVRKEWVERSDKAPIFTHPEIQWLYENGDDIAKEKIQALLALPRQTLIADLLKVLDDAMARFDYFAELDWDEKTYSFPVHALYLLAELRATESLNHALNVIRQDDEWTEYWYADLLTEIFPMLFYQLIGSDLHILKNYLLEPDNEAFQRMAVTTAVTIMCYHEPKRRQEGIQLLNDILLDFYNNKDTYQNIIDIDLMDSIVIDLLDLNAKESLPIIKKLFDVHLISAEIGDTWEEIVKEFDEDKDFHFDTITNIYDHYALMNSWNTPISEEKKLEYEKELEELRAQRAQKEQELKDAKSRLNNIVNGFPVVGRNEPCPCGSGMKYKKCHGK